MFNVTSEGVRYSVSGPNGLPLIEPLGDRADVEDWAKNLISPNPVHEVHIYTWGIWRIYRGKGWWGIAPTSFEDLDEANISGGCSEDFPHTTRIVAHKIFQTTYPWDGECFRGVTLKLYFPWGNVEIVLDALVADIPQEVVPVINNTESGE